MARRGLMLSAVVFGMLCAAPLAAAQETIELAAGIVAGNCNEEEIAVELNAPVLPDGEHEGDPEAQTAASSLTELPAELDVLTGQQTAIIIYDGDGNPLACGPIGGVPDQGSLAMELDPVTEHGVGGVAYISPNGPDSVSIILFVTGVDGLPDHAAMNDFAPEEVAYIEAVTDLTTELSESMNRTSALFNDPLPQDDDWRQSVSVEALTWQGLTDELNELEAPPAFAEVHATLVEAFDTLDTAADDMLDFIELEDAAALASATENIEQANVLIDEAHILIEQIIEDRNE